MDTVEVFEPAEYTSVQTVHVEEYEPPVLLDLEEVASGAGVCITGGHAAPIDDEPPQEPLPPR